MLKANVIKKTWKQNTYIGLNLVFTLRHFQEKEREMRVTI